MCYNEEKFRRYKYMRKITILVLVATMFMLNACSGKDTSSLSENLKTEYAFYEDSIKNIKSTMGLLQEQADNVFTVLVTECGINEKVQYVFKGNSDNVYTVWAGLLQLEVTLKDNAVDTVMNGTEQIYPAVHKNVLMQAKVKKDKVMNGFGTEQIGERAYIEISKEDLRNVTQEDFEEFANSVVKDSGYNWFSIICDDGTGICFIGSMEHVAQYGKMNDEGAIEEVIGDITFYTYEER